MSAIQSKITASLQDFPRFNDPAMNAARAQGFRESLGSTLESARADVAFANRMWGLVHDLAATAASAGAAAIEVRGFLQSFQKLMAEHSG